MKSKKPKSNVQIVKNRKQLRKQGRKEKKARKHDYYTNRKKPGQFVLSPASGDLENDSGNNTKKMGPKAKQLNTLPDQTNRDMAKEKKQQLQLQKQMNKQRNKQLLDANLEEDRNIKKLEKQLKLNKRKTKAIPKSFAADGLDYLLEVCDSENMQGAVSAEQQLNEVNEEFEEDFALMTGKSVKKTSKIVTGKNKPTYGSDDENAGSDDSFEDFLNEDDGSDSEFDDSGSDPEETSFEPRKGRNNLKTGLEDDDFDEDSDEIEEIDQNIKGKAAKSKKRNKYEDDSDAELLEIDPIEDGDFDEDSHEIEEIDQNIKGNAAKLKKRDKYEDDTKAELIEIDPKNQKIAVKTSLKSKMSLETSKKVEDGASEEYEIEPEDVSSKKQKRNLAKTNFKSKKEDFDSSGSKPKEISSKNPNQKINSSKSQKIKEIDNSDEFGSDPEEINSKKRTKQKTKLSKTNLKLKKVIDESESELEVSSKNQTIASTKINTKSQKYMKVDTSDGSESEPEEISSKKTKKPKIHLPKTNSKLEKAMDVDDSDESESEPEEISSKKPSKRKQAISKTDSKSKKQKVEKASDSEISDLGDFGDAFEDDDSDLDEKESNKNCAKKNDDGTWEDIYGRSRDKDGTIINKSESLSITTKYVPPAVRAKMENALPEDAKRVEKLNRLKKQLKGLLNRLAESNMHNISTQIEELYMKNSRNDMNETLTALISEAVVSNVSTPERLLLEHVVLITILHANVGTEVGAHFLQNIVKRFDEVFNEDNVVENKTLDNLINIIAQLYNFKVFDSKLLYQILTRLTNKFEEKEVECILHVLKAVGFTLRRNDPIALKDLILNLQKQAAVANDAVKDNPRVKFMLDILLAIKNNNMNKIPNYDTTYAEHLKKILKGFIRKGNYVTQLNIGLDDLLKADERGKWWVVGSAWTGKIGEDEEIDVTKTAKSEDYSQKLLTLARKQRMNTDIRRNIFCIIMSAEDYLDAFEKILHLGLKNQQEREIIHVILHCCLQEKQYNPYYGVLSQKFCDYDRKYQMTIKFSVWDKLKTLTQHSGPQISNLAKLLSHLFLEKGLPISTLKIVQFGELDKITLRFMRQVLLGILLTEDVEQCQGVFDKVGQSEKLKMFRESLRLFIHHFLLRNLNSDSIPEEQKRLLEERAKMVENVLTVNDKKIRF